MKVQLSRSAGLRLRPPTTSGQRPNRTRPTKQISAMRTVAGQRSRRSPTTSADPVLPVAPTAPTAYAVPNPDTSGYTIVRMIAGGAGGECKAAASIGPVTAGDLVQTVLNEVVPPTVLEFDQNSACADSGYSLCGTFRIHASTQI